MSTQKIHDDELFAFLVDDDFDPARADAIRAALLRDHALAARLATISDAYEQVFAAPERDDLFEARIWRGVVGRTSQSDGRTAEGREGRRMDAPADAEQGQRSRQTGATSPKSAGHRSAMSGLRGPRLALAASLLIAVGAGFLIGRIGRDAAPPPPAIASTPLPAENAAQRVLALHLAAHFESTERALLVAANSPDDTETARVLARDLIDGNRVYAAAAERAGRPQLADFLRQLEPVLLELANGGELSAGLVAEQIRERDLAFKTRAAAALARRELGTDNDRIEL